MPNILYSGLLSLISSARAPPTPFLPSLDAGRRLSTPGSFGLGFSAWGLGAPRCEAEPLCCPLPGGGGKSWGWGAVGGGPGGGGGGVVGAGARRRVVCGGLRNRGILTTFSDYSSATYSFVSVVQQLKTVCARDH
ncbi:hypothetical protein B0H13DRAFT_2078095 [Mycena leptocephala]|nr:hypothetical protein B0H13DRAFT_2078095 [Mycena leptocephala]